MTQTDPPQPPTPPPPPALARFAAIGLSVLLAISVLPALWITLFRGDAVLWFSSLFEILVLAAAAFGILSGLGKFTQGWGLSLACVAGTVLVCGVFAFLEVRANFGSEPGVAPLIKPYLAFRLAIAAGLGLAASYAIFSRNRACWSALIKGILVLTPPVGVLAWVALSGRGFLGSTQANPGSEAARILLLVLGGLVLVGFISVGAHLIIRAYELGRPEAIEDGKA